MKDAEDEAFDEIARRQGAWGGGFKAKQAMAADKLQEDLINYGTSWSQDGKRIDPMSVYKEPLAWMCSSFDGEPCEQTNHDECENPIPLCTLPPQRPWVGLTDEEIDAWTPEIHGVIRSIEQALKEKNNGT